MKHRSGRVIPGLLVVATFFLLVGFFWEPLLSAHGLTVPRARQMDPNRIWEATVTFLETGLAEKDIDNSDGSRIDTERLHRSIRSRVVIHSCGLLSDLHFSGLEKSLEDRETYHKNRKVPVRHCPGDEAGQEYSGRFNQEVEDREMTYRFVDSIPPGSQGAFGDDSPARFALVLFPPDRYQIVAASLLHSALEGQSTQTTTRGCEGETESHTKIYKLAPPGQRPPPQRTDTETGSVETVFTPLLPYITSGTWTGEVEFDPEGFSGQDTLANDEATHPGDLARRVTVAWDFKPKEGPCRDAYDLLYQDLAWAEAYADASLLGQTGDLDKYLESVGEQAYENYGRYLPPDMMGASVAMSVDPATCGLHGFEESFETLERHCLPKVIQEAVLSHELEHVKQCQTQGDLFRDTGNFQARARFEVEAHLRGIHHLKSYVEEHCQESGNLYNLSDVDVRIARLEAWLGG